MLNSVWSPDLEKLAMSDDAWERLFYNLLGDGKVGACEWLRFNCGVVPKVRFLERRHP